MRYYYVVLFIICSLCSSKIVTLAKEVDRLKKAIDGDNHHHNNDHDAVWLSLLGLWGFIAVSIVLLSFKFDEMRAK